MCGRFAFPSDWDEFLQLFPDLVIDGDIAMRYNVAPSENIPTLLHDGQLRLTTTRWGLIPHWADDRKIGNKMFNARSETLREKPSFKGSFRTARCLIPAQGYFEWKAAPNGKGKVPYFFKFRDGRSMIFAGLYARNRKASDQEIISSTIITTAANAFTADYHHRMPVILSPDVLASWLDLDNEELDQLYQYLVPYAGNDMEVFPVSDMVNRAGIEDPSLILPKDGDQEGQQELF